MSERFMGEIRIFGGNYAPVGWALCDGQLLTISNYDALFSLLGTQYGGDGRVTFALPDLRGRIAAGRGTGPGLTPRSVGQAFGYERISLKLDQIPSHSHPLQGSNNLANSQDPKSNVMAKVGAGSVFYEAAATASALKPLAQDAVEVTGDDAGHYNMMPYTVINYIIALTGTYPSRS
ncbi:phage tail protein [Acanthopleuribacter pedis]|uniref:Phage tail protein n=1 Tax=Acanthopleuribacter pedis TaxID=442870 RepID=A0A8J7QR63_9BACT|nr:tail fiber protein [Acanthopleuribacter pedis]MBO1322868.1 phage tail protein [Acanthopleuribacter pedis]